MDYLVNEIGESQELAKMHLGNFERNPDIGSELILWIQKREFQQNAIIVQGYSAEEICKISNLLPIGAYNFLIALREHPEFALADLKAGFPKR